MNNSEYLKVTSQKGLVCASGDDSYVHHFAETIRHIEARCGADVASLFAEPVRPSTIDPANPELSWYTSADGRAIELGAIDEAARGPIVATLRSRLEKLRPVLEEPGVGPRVASWLYVPSPDSILAVGGKPVLIDWGFLPAAVAGSRPQREAHFNSTIGRYAPDLKLPPFTQQEQEIYASQLRGPEPIQQEASPRRPGFPPRSAAAVTSKGDPETDPTPLSPPVAAMKTGWKPPLVAALIAAAILVFLAWPGVLVGPKRVDLAMLEREEKELREGNKVLEEKLRLLDGQSKDKICRAPDGKPPQLVPLGPDGKPVPRQDPLPPPINKVEIKPPGSTSPTALPAFFEQTVVNISGPVSNDSGVAGSGFFINPKQVVTNRHVVEHIKTGKIVLTNKTIGRQIPARIVAISDPDPREDGGGSLSHEDLAVIEVDAGDHPYMPIGPSPAKMQDIWAIGYPGYLNSDDMTIERGIVTTKPNYTVPSIIHSAKIAPGNSGGPLADICGRVVGVNTQTMRDRNQPIIGFSAQDVTVLAAFLTKHGIKSFSDENPECAQVKQDPPAPVIAPNPAQQQAQPPAQQPVPQAKK